MARRLSLARQVFVLQLTVIVLLVGAGGLLAYLDARSTSENSAERRVLTLALGLAELPSVGEALTLDDPSVVLQPLAESVRRATGADFIVFMAPDRTRYSHPSPELVGEKFLGTIDPALAGEPLTETYPGTLGPSVRAVVPIFDSDGDVVALVSIGILRGEIGRELQQRVPLLLGVSGAALAIAAWGSLAISRRLSRQTLGLGPDEITRMYEQHDAVLHAVHEGLVIVDPGGRIVLVNDEAVRLLGLPPGSVDPGPLTASDVDAPLGSHLASGRPVDDLLVVHRDRVLVVNSELAAKDGRILGTVTTLRDHTDLEALTGELDTARGFAEALRAQAHESANRLHTVVTMIELGNPERAVEFATEELATTQQLTDRVVGTVEEPALAALLLAKAAQAHEKGVEFVITPDSRVGEVGISSRDLVTLVGNLVDNAIDAALAGGPPRRVTLTATSSDEGLRLVVADSGAGIDPDHLDDAFTRGWSTKLSDQPHGRGLGLALVRQIVERHRGSLHVESDGGAVFTVDLPGGADPAHEAER
ncbi:MAG: sensor histidine kinase [Aeromicrobium sp.]|uniref:sensor histidine kinase n=1 Tax=Aeromicrobium sp. TaxID=1871063 RepID=UPI0025BE5FA8|nr:sensor histidine kinase [Aeromicrobium sp.]MCK5892514.1 sensor histidine kinase [Aeromicrobium sp.]MDF1703982.1 sensor histidine kinase [Aeromicrobium sp.]